MMLRRDKKFSEAELIKLGKEVRDMLSRLHKIDDAYFISDYNKIIDSLDDMVDVIKDAIGSMKLNA